MAKTAEYLVKKRETLKRLRSQWDPMFEIVSQYVYVRAGLFETKNSPGSFITDGSINDSTASRSLQAMASAVLGSLWKTGGKTFRLKPTKNISDSPENRKYFEEINMVLTEAMESEKAGFELALQEALCEQGSLGTGTPGVFEGDYKTPLVYKSWPLKNCYFAQSKDGFIDTIYYDEMLTVEQVVNRYGLENVSEAVRKKFEKLDSKFEDVLVCIAVEPRTSEDMKDAPAAGNRAYPYASYHFEVENKHFLKESGFGELPCKPSRWYKLSGEVYGRSPAMDALPAIMQLNAYKEAMMVGVEKKVEPPVFVMDDGSLGAATVDTSAGGLSVFNTTGRMNGQQPVGTIIDVGELQSVWAAIEDLKLEVMQHFLIDKLYDLNNKTRMTLGEAQIRYDIRSDGLSSVYARIFNEQLTPLIERSFNICFSMGLLGIVETNDAMRARLEKEGIDPIIIPMGIAEAMAQGREIFKIEYISPAAQILREMERRGTVEVFNAVMTAAPVVQEVLDILDVDEAIEALRDLSGAPPRILRGKDAAQSIRRARNEANMQMAAAQKSEMESKSAKNIASAGKDAAMAGAPA